MSTPPSKLVWTAMLLPLAGCVEPPTRPQAGAVTAAYSTRSEAAAPDFVFVDSKDETQHLSTFYGYATILAIVEQPCSKEKEPLAAEAAKAHPHVTVIEIATPPDGCTLHNECVQVRGDRARNLIFLCDGAGAARKCFGVSARNAVILLDHFGGIVDRGGLLDLDILIDKACELAGEVELRNTTALHRW